MLSVGCLSNSLKMAACPFKAFPPAEFILSQYSPLNVLDFTTNASKEETNLAGSPEIWMSRAYSLPILFLFDLLPMRRFGSFPWQLYESLFSSFSSVVKVRDSWKWIWSNSFIVLFPISVYPPFAFLTEPINIFGKTFVIAVLRLFSMISTFFT